MASEEPTPIYCDGAQVGCAPFTVAIVFTVSQPPGKGTQLPTPVADLRMSPEHAKILCIILYRQLKDFEQQLGQQIPIHPQVAQHFGLSPSEDW